MRHLDEGGRVDSCVALIVLEYFLLLSTDVAGVPWDIFCGV
jgi:hypothetical protein